MFYSIRVLSGNAAGKELKLPNLKSIIQKTVRVVILYSLFTCRREVRLTEEQITLSEVAPLQAAVLRCEASEHIQTVCAELVA